MKLSVLPVKFLHALQPLNCIFSRTCGAGRPQVGLCTILLVFFKFRHMISELHRPIAVKLYHRIDIWLSFITQVKKFGGVAVS